MKYLGQIFLVFLLSNSYGQGITFKNINTTHGLTSNLVFNACQGPDGLLWIISNNKLNSYNEGIVTEYTNDLIPGIDDHKITDLLIDDSNIVWLRSANRELFFLDRNRVLNKVDLTNDLPTQILNLIKNDAGKVEFISKEGHFYYNVERAGLDTIHTFDKPIYTGVALQVSKEKDGKYVFSANNKAILYDSKIGQVEYTFDQVRSHGAVLINKRQMLVSTYTHHELFLVDIQQDKIVKNLALDILKKYPQINTYYRRIKHLDDEYVGITSGHQGLFIMNTRDFSVQNYAHDISNPSSISSDNSYLLYPQENGNVFVTTRTSGLNIFNRNRKDARHIRSFVDHDQSNIFKGHISHLVKDKLGYYWLASSQGLLKYDMRTGIMKKSVRKEEKNKILGIISMYIDERDRIYIGVSGGGLEVLDNQGNEIKTYTTDSGEQTKIKSNFVYAIMEGVDEKIWVGTSMGINIINHESLKIESLAISDPFEILNTAIRELKLIGEETFIGTWRKGGYVLIDDTFSKLEIPEVYDAVSVTDFEMDKKGKLYVGTEDGLFSFHKTSHAGEYEFEEKIMDGRVLSLDKDAAGSIWMALENTLYRFDSDGLNVEQFNSENGFTGGGFRMHASYMDKEGMLYYGQNTGFCFFDPMDLQKNELNINPYITGVFQGDQKKIVNGDDEMILPSEENNIGIFYQNIDIWNRPELTYEYSISENEKEWETAVTNPILIQNIPPGNYQIDLRASLDGENWVESKNQIALIVLFPWWRSWWFYALMTALVGGFLYTLIKFYQKLSAERKEKQKYDESLKYFSLSMHKYAETETEFWDVILDCLLQLDIDACSIYLLDFDGDHLYRQAVKAPDKKDEDYINQPGMLRLGVDMIGRVGKQRNMEVIHDLSTSKEFSSRAHKRISKVSIPILSNDQLHGVIDCEHGEKNYFNDQRISFITTIATIVATKIEAYQAEEERKEAEISLSNNLKKVSQLEMKSLRSQMNPHFMFNSLNSINNFIVKNDQENASDYLTSFAQLMRVILENSRQDWVSLESELKALRLYVGMEKLRFENTFYYHESIDDDINTMSTLVPPMLIQPYIENAIWHGLLPKTSNHCNLRLSIRKEGEYLRIEVEDDGIGTKVSSQRKSNFNVTKKSFGQRIISERLDMINEIYKLDAGVEVIDKSDFSEEETGTKVILSMKLKMSSL